MHGQNSKRLIICITEGEKRICLKLKLTEEQQSVSVLPKQVKVERAKAFRSHILNKKTTKRKRHRRKGGYLSSANEATIKSMMPYK